MIQDHKPRSKVNQNSPVRLTDPGTPAITYAITPDSSRVVYIARKDEGTKQPYRIPIGGGEATKLNEHLLDGGDVFWFLFSPDNNLVAYVGDVETNGVRDLFTVPIHGGQAINLSPPLGAGGTINSRDTCADGQHVVYVADWEEINLYELYVSLKAYQLFDPFIAGS